MEPPALPPHFRRPNRPIEAACGSISACLKNRAKPNAAATIGWLQTHGVEFTIPVYYLSAGPARIQPVGGGKAIVEKLADAARSAGVKFLYETAMNGLVMADGHRVRGMETQSGDGVTTTLDADAIILASGGFQGNSAMMRAQFGLGAETL